MKEYIGSAMTKTGNCSNNFKNTKYLYFLKVALLFNPICADLIFHVIN